MSKTPKQEDGYARDLRAGNCESYNYNAVDSSSKCICEARQGKSGRGPARKMPTW